MAIFFLILFNFHSWFYHAQVDRVLHAALNKYAFFAVTGSFYTLRELISMVKIDNDRQQVHFDAKGLDSPQPLHQKYQRWANQTDKKRAWQVLEDLGRSRKKRDAGRLEGEHSDYVNLWKEVLTINSFLNAGQTVSAYTTKLKFVRGWK